MVKKILSLSLLIIFAHVAVSYAAAPTGSKARTATLGTGIEQVVGIGDLSSGYTPEVTAAGALGVTNVAREVTARYDDGLIYTGACFVQGVYIEGESAGDYAAIYDNTSATTATLKFDPRIDTASGSTWIDTKGAYFATGIYADAIDADVLVTVVYDY